MNGNGFAYVKGDMHQLAHLIERIERTCLDFFHPFNNEKNIAFFSLCKHMTLRSKDILYLINLNYCDNDDIISSYQNIDGTEILLRSIIEASVIYNILLNNGDELTKEFLKQTDIDLLNIQEQFRGASHYFDRKKAKEKYDRYAWAQSLSKDGKKIYSIEDLIEIANLTQEGRDIFHNEINLCNSFSHPNLINDSFYVGAIQDGNIHLVIGVLETITSIMYGILQSFQILHQYTFITAAPNYISYLPILQVFTKSPDVDLALYYINTFKFDYLEINQKIYDIDVTQSERMMSWLLMYSMMVNPDNEGRRLDRSIQKLLDHLTHNVRELIYGFEKKVPYLYITKIRFVLENLAMIWILLDYDETQVEVYQAHTDIKTYIDSKKIPDSLLKQFGKTQEDVDNTIIDANGEQITLKEAYKRNVAFIQEFLKERYQLNLSEGEILKSNAWMVDSAKEWNKTPGNMKYVSYPMVDLKDSHVLKKFDFRLDHYIKGLYSFSSTHCHPTFYSSINNDWEKHEGLLNETYYVIMTYLDLVLEKLDLHYPLIKQIPLPIFQEYKESIEKIFEESKQFVNLKDN